MDQFNLLSLIFLVYLFVLFPRAALRSARVVRQTVEAGVPLPRTRVLLSTLFTLLVTFMMAWVNAQAMGRDLWAVDWSLRNIALGVVAFIVLLGAIPLSRRLRTPEELRRQLLNGIVPRNNQEMGLFTLAAIGAGIAEEAAYRGVAVWLLTLVFGAPIPAILMSTMAFAVAHAVQGGKSMAIVAGVALLFHGLVTLTGTLVIAMIVHAAYDIVAGIAARKKADELERSAGQQPGANVP
ncbi:MAG: CPBP family intramembrane metalloprotease [Gemmatimonadetes bacterium]|nr:CPBP family intramembrane metalloprotease [Gemmatimonadota bacterium]